MSERYRELPAMTYCGASVGHVGALDIFFLRTMKVKWDDLEEAIVIEEEQNERSNLRQE